jgi:hypothetical protein
VRGKCGKIKRRGVAIKDDGRKRKKRPTSKSKTTDLGYIILLIFQLQIK